ncbi:L-histidine N(alpha)-methyltransferase [Epidermidibacterium keratini]|uniref:L-histidine N(Alpha)-methyltransferase n=1 Tax=Epidermidibacterium keratini TaxID=1891644 RepID=A0A7L4YRB9_9ACTN|nr:L-histidine N(alpha)-methyltransferase [Epidermidibacterium keratini]QHC01493.1 L-histidine N(alpha)-methyltransferase [Epidermidibacterium keratini]
MTAPVRECVDGAPIDILLRPEDLRAALLTDAREGLGSTPKTLPPKYFYDAEGSRLFEQITRQPKYYPTRTEHAILSEYAEEIAQAAGAEVLLELGSGSSEKTRLLLDAMGERLDGYVPVDVSPDALREAILRLRVDYPDLHVHGAVADFDHHLGDLPAPGKRMVALLGSTLGNYRPHERARFLGAIASAMHPGESLLLGLDLVKDPSRLVAAYDDAAGVTAAFNRNVLRVLNRELGADFAPDAFEHVARWDSGGEWMEMRLRATRPMKVRLPAIELDVDFADGEELRTETSAKFRREPITEELSQHGLSVVKWWSDPAGDYAMLLAVK